ncbi:hypothetical protein SAMN05428989_0880 [Pseudoxanthomonas sp. GM95]|nr:hypothetical protein SAMN05428989_0880 [Pseudoxanthomonas sp. GM95]
MLIVCAQVVALYAPTRAFGRPKARRGDPAWLRDF